MSEPLEFRIHGCFCCKHARLLAELIAVLLHITGIFFPGVCIYIFSDVAFEAFC
jgi:hypothetical protein